jgi:hypothetical protein
MRNILNVVFDILTLMAIVIAGVGHMLPWFRSDLRADRIMGKEFKGDFRDFQQAEQARHAEDEARRQTSIEIMAFQAWHASRSGVALAVLAVLVSLSLLINWRPLMRRILVLAMFASCLVAILFITLSMTHYPITEWHRQYAGRLWTDAGFVTALAPTCFAAAFCLIRMIWTMPPVRARPAPPPDLPQATPLETRPPLRPRERMDDAGLFVPRE